MDLPKAPWPRPSGAIDLLVVGERLREAGACAHVAMLQESETDRLAFAILQRACDGDHAGIEKIIRPLLDSPDPTMLRQVQRAMNDIAAQANRRAALAAAGLPVSPPIAKNPTQAIAQPPLEGVESPVSSPPASFGHQRAHGQPERGRLTFSPGTVLYRGGSVSLRGKPWEVLQALAQAPHQTCTANSLLGTIWADTSPEEDTVRSAVSDARKALRKLMKEAGVQGPDDPIPAVDRGTGRLAWRLDLS
jgi:hypothetical protein